MRSLQHLGMGLKADFDPETQQANVGGNGHPIFLGLYI